MKTKICTKCKEEKSLEEFNRDTRYSKDGRRARCKICENVYERKRRIKFKKKHPKYSAAKEWSNNLRGKYGITTREWQQMFDKQNGVCSICGLPEVSRKLGVDHRHSDGKVRELLCNKCNHLVGVVETDFWGLKNRVITYLEKHNG